MDSSSLKKPLASLNLLGLRDFHTGMTFLVSDSKLPLLRVIFLVVEGVDVIGVFKITFYEL